MKPNNNQRQPEGKWLRELTKKETLWQSKTGKKQKVTNKAFKETSSLFSNIIFLCYKKFFTWKKRASKKDEKTSPQKSLSSSSNGSDIETDFDTDPFKVISKTRKYKHKLPTKIVNYAKEQFHSYLKNADIKKIYIVHKPRSWKSKQNQKNLMNLWRTF